MFDASVVAETLHKIVAEKGADYVYPKASGACTYTECTEDGEAYPSCIVGHVVAALDPEEFAQIAEYEAKTEESFSVDELIEGATGEYLVPDSDEGRECEYLSVAPFTVPDVVEAALSVAQTLQDRGHTWGEAQEGFDRVLAGEEHWAVQRDIKGRASGADE